MKSEGLSAFIKPRIINNVRAAALLIEELSMEQRFVRVSSTLGSDTLNIPGCLKLQGFQQSCTCMFLIGCLLRIFYV